ncbi:c-type cytochrome [Congregibacter litoralis]|uniref:Cytochrome c n=1 Tax=Congregibacter litoralis KT71 TaxID=314285 RepID=A4A512_9GAMM|nr:c-type cytochrome [Congregibacter litoralis]EAQ98883.1 Cytochrome c [Congregibacter litoralis KT71]
MDKKFWIIMRIAFTAGLVSAIVMPSFAAAADERGTGKTPNPLKGMTSVEASKGIELPMGSDDEAVAKGRYLVNLLGCASCHTDGALIGKPDPNKTLAGSTIGIAYSNPMVNTYPGAVYPPNLTPDKETGLGDWTLDEIVTLLRSGKTRHGRQTMAIMPWTSYAQLSTDDARAIGSYLLSLEPVKNKVPKQVLPGTPAKTPLVHVGLYRSR